MNAQQINRAWTHFSNTIGGTLATPRHAEEANRLYDLLETLMDALDKDGRTHEREALLHLIGTLIEEWETRAETAFIETLSSENQPREHLEALMQERGVTQYQLAKEGIVSQGTLSQILAGKRGISKGLARKLATRFQIPIDLLL
jgi:HTH-type transcriptional regulator / antitoxin HigA